MRIGDWSSDVCSSDLVPLVAPLGADDYYDRDHVAYRKVFGPEIPGQPVKTIRSQPRSHGYRIALAFHIPLSATNSRSTLNSSIWWPCPGKTWTTISPASRKARTASTSSGSAPHGRSEEHTSELQSLMSSS